MLHEIKLKTNERCEFIDISYKINMIIDKSGIKEGICLIYSPHTTACLTINENSDPDVKSDMNETLKKLIPINEHYKHSEGNSDAHIKCSMVGCSEFIIIKDSKLLLGAWQGIIFCEFDGPRTRRIYVKIIRG